jgi:hypothetical protein
MIVRKSKDDPKVFYGYMRNKHKVKQVVTQLVKEDGTSTETDEESAGVLSDFFKSVFTEEGDGPLPEFANRVQEDEGLQEVEFTEESILKKLLGLKVNKACGPDEIHPRLLRECAPELCKPLYHIFRKSADSGTVPTDWKIANVTQIHKKGSRSKANNYRPVSLTSQVCKVMESIVKDNMVKFLEEKNVFTPHQHGFCRGKSCLTNLLETLELWTSALDSGYSVDSVYLDYQKAFDTVPTQRLMKKLKAYGIRGSVAQWLEVFLTGRRMRVSVRGSESPWVNVTSGVPQGSVIGPLLFLLYVNDIPESLECLSKMFADDTKVFTVVKCEADNERLQRDLNTLDNWSEDWLLGFNVSKCKRMHLGRRNPGYKYTMNDAELQETEEEKDLGVWIVNSLKPEKQVASAVNKAMVVLRAIGRTFENFDIETFHITYRTYVRPHLEYCVQAWSPYYRKDIISLENVQRRATKMVSGFRNLSYEQRLQRLKIMTLEERRVHGDLIETYKIVTKKENIDPNQFFHHPTSAPHTLRGHAYKLTKARALSLSRRRFFSQRVVDMWNNLPANIVEAKTVHAFKDKLDKNWPAIWATYRRLVTSLQMAHQL